MAHLSAEQLEKGVICASAGNHAQGGAGRTQARLPRRDRDAHHHAAQVKIDVVQALGGEVDWPGKVFRRLQARRQAAKKGLTLCTFDDPYVIAGQNVPWKC